MNSLHLRRQSNPSAVPGRAEVESPASRAWSSRWLVIPVLLIALAARGLEVSRQDTIHNDAPRYLEIADDFARGDWRAALVEDFHPLTGLLIAGLGAATPLDPAGAGTLLGVLFGTLLVASIWALTRDQLGPSVALLAGLCAAVHPRFVAVSSGVQSDGIFLGLFALAWLCAWRALRSDRFAPALAAGACCGLAYLTRPEGLAIGVVLAVWLAVDLVRGQRRFAPTLAIGAAFVLALLAVASPYIWALHEITGAWTLSQKKSITSMAGIDELLDSSAVHAAPPLPAPAALEPRQPEAPASAEPAPQPEPVPQPELQPPPSPPSYPRRIAAALAEVFKDGARACPPTMLLVALFGFRRRRPGPAAMALLGFGVLFLTLLIGLHLSVGYVSRRHWLPVVIFLLPFAGRGLWTLGRMLDARFPAFAARPWAGPAVVGLIVAGFLVEMATNPADPVKLARREAASWLRAHAGGGAVAAQRARDAFYAGADEFVQLNEAYPPEAVLEKHSADFLLIDESVLTPDEAGDRARVLHRVPYPGGAILVFAIARVADPRPGP